MGRIKSRFVKSSSERIFQRGKEEFTEDFDKNKEIVTKYADIPSKKLRNTIVGYITRLAKKQEREELS
jgi:small subunit ribosomal protein S17e